MPTDAESQALVQSIGEHCIMHFDRSSLTDLVVKYYPSDSHTDISVALKDNSREELQRVYDAFASEIMPLYLDETVLDIHFLHQNASVFERAQKNTSVKSYVMA